MDGLIHVQEQEVLEVVECQIGDDLTSPSTIWQIRDDMRAIWALGYFKNIISRDERSGSGWALVFEVVEKPLVTELRYEGAKRYKRKKLNREIEYTGRERLFFDEALADLYRDKILGYYTSQSFPNTNITWRVEELAAPDTVAIVYQIEEGTRLPVKKIVFEGNTAVRDKELRKNIETKQSWWFIIKRHYDDAVAEDDLKKIQYVYWDHGYLDAQASKEEVEEFKKGLKVTFRIEEGEPYTIGKIILQGNTVFSDEELLSTITQKPGDIFSFRQMTLDEIEMIDLYRGQGFLDTRIPPVQEQWVKDEVNHIVDIHLRIAESPRKYLGKISLEGVVTLDDGSVIPTEEGEFKTKDFVILREIELKEGEPLDWTKVVESDRNLVNLNFFKTTGIPIPGRTNLVPGFIRQPQQDPGSNIENLLLRLEEIQTGMFTFGGGISTTYGPSVFATLTERNMFGYGVRGSITGEYGRYRNRVALSFFEPHLFNSDYSLDWDIYYIDQQGFGRRRFDEERIGTSVTFGKELNDELTLLLGLKGENTDLSPESGSRYDLDPNTIPDVFNLGSNVTTSILFGGVYDTRDFKLNPTTGIYSRTTVEVAGLTDNEFVKFQAEGNLYKEIVRKLVLAFSTELDLADAYGDPGYVPLQERFFTGGARTIRGFEEGGIGDQARVFYKDPTLGAFRTSLGGEAAFVENTELRYSFTEMFQGVLFLDMGSNWPEISDIDPSEFRFSTGAGLRVRIPGLNAVLSVDFPVVLRKESGDETEFFHFSFGQSF